MLEVKELTLLVELKQSGNLSAAARRLHLTQSALSHRLKTLETRLGIALCVRGKPLRFTPAGQRLLTLADEVLPRIAAVERALRDLAHGQAGRLHIAVECHSCFSWLTPAMDAFRTQWPQVALDVSLDFNFEPLPALAQGELEVVITSDPRPLPGITFTPLFTFPLMLALPPDHVLAARAFIRPQDLSDQTLITYPVERSRLDIFTRFLDPAGITPAAVRTTAVTLLMIQWVASRRGVCALPSWALVEHTAQGQVVARPLGETGLWRTLYAAIPTDASAYIKAFVEMARRVSDQTLTEIQPLSPDDITTSVRANK